MPFRERPPEPIDEWRVLATVDELMAELDLCAVPIDADRFAAERILALNGSWAELSRIKAALKRRADAPTGKDNR